MLSSLSRLRARIAEWWAVEDPEDRIEGSGEVHLDPAYNGRYTAERRLQELAAAEDEREDGQS
jgi:hypothetical protein